MTKEDTIRNQILLIISRAHQATSISRAIRLSEQPIHPLFKHIADTQYFTIVNDISKLFDKSGDNLNSFLLFASGASSILSLLNCAMN